MPVELMTRNLMEGCMQAATANFHISKELVPIWIMMTAEGELLPPIATPFDEKLGTLAKDAVAEVIRNIVECGVTRIVYISEVWLRNAGKDETQEEINRPVRDFPDREEAILVTGEDTLGQASLSRKITRVAGKATLGPLVWDETGLYSGRFADLLRKGTLQ